MKINKWTLGLAAVGLVGLPTLVQAEEKLSAVTTALSSTTISGYVDTSAQWDLGIGNANLPGFVYNKGKQDGFNLDKVKLRIEKPLDESQWSAGYRVDLLFGPDANTFGTASAPFGASTSDFAIQQAYVSLRAPYDLGIGHQSGVTNTYHANDFAGYLSFQATEKLSFHTRAEYLWQRASLPALPAKVFALTETLQYDLWKDVMSRLEIRWDHAANDVHSYGGTDFSALGTPTKDNAVMIAANIIYKF